ncbi:zinc ribbon domain-containing protein [Halobacterium salinarum]|uniref:zinc ribbon domain-containing protein n=1 Tax=Halobacterium salinarum TaxID=2242 RepID=UPI002556E5DA|nr:zinc ribbon domain-containing protein [Halobacterium salinarum]MDL0142722.1 zinc ribbon domain-containing protein [Halobacterium salinarum]
MNYCGNCGAKLVQQNQYCTNCGAEISARKTEQEGSPKAYNISYEVDNVPKIKSQLGNHLEFIEEVDDISEEAQRISDNIVSALKNLMAIIEEGYNEESNQLRLTVDDYQKCKNKAESEIEKGRSLIEKLENLSPCGIFERSEKLYTEYKRDIDKFITISEDTFRDVDDGIDTKSKEMAQIDVESLEDKYYADTGIFDQKHSESRFRMSAKSVTESTQKLSESLNNDVDNINNEIIPRIKSQL